MKYSKLITLALVALTTAQNTNSTNSTNSTDTLQPTALQACAKENKCELTDLACLALCTGVPNPSSDQINQTTDCVAKCPQNNTEEYKTCSQNCINNHFRKHDIAKPNGNGTNSEGGKNSTVIKNSTSVATVSGADGINQFGKLIGVTMATIFFTVYSVL